MKLRNKKTGEICEVLTDSIAVKVFIDSHDMTGYYTSLAELNEEWEDAPEEPKEYWCIDWTEIGGIYRNKYEDELDDFNKQIGNHFGTREEAKKAVEKLKAWKRMKDKGFRFEGWTIDDGLKISICTNFDGDNIYSNSEKEIKNDLDLLFPGGEE